MNMNKSQFRDEYLPAAKSAFQAPQMEDFACGVKYAFSYSPKAAHSYDDWMTDQARRRSPAVWTKQRLNELYEKLHYCHLYDLHVEGSSKGRLHFHGSITTYEKDLLGFYTHDLLILQSLGTYCIKPYFGDKESTSTVDNFKAWEIYISKQDSIWKPYFKKYVWCYPNTHTVHNYPFKLILADHIDNKEDFTNPNDIVAV